MKKTLDIPKPKQENFASHLTLRYINGSTVHASLNCPLLLLYIPLLQSPQLSLLCSTVLRINIKCQLIIRPGFCESGLKKIYQNPPKQ